MSIGVNRTTHGVNFNTGISTAEYNEGIVGQTKGQTQQPILPGSTTVSEALDGVFPKDPTVLATILGELAASGSSTQLRTAAGYRHAAAKTIALLKTKSGPAAQVAAAELEKMMDDGELLDSYRASLLES